MNGWLRQQWRGRSREFWAALLIVVAALALRLAAAAWLGLDRAPTPGSDEYEYDQYAWNLAQGNGYRGPSPDVADQNHITAYRGPVPPLMWAPLYRLFGHSYAAVRILQCLLSAATAWMLYRIGRRCFGPLPGLAAGAAYALWPTAIYFCSTFFSEIIATFWFTAFLLAARAFAERPTGRRALGAGLLLGAALQTRANFVFLLPMLFVWGWVQFPAWRARRRAFLVPLVAVATLLPWTVRNYMHFHAVIPFSTQGGSTFLQGNNRLVVTRPELYGYMIWDTNIPEYADALRGAGDEVARDRLAKEFAIDWLRENPDRYPFLVWHKVRRGLTPFLQPHTPRHYRLGTLLSWGPVLALTVIVLVPTLLRFLRRREPGWLLHLALAQFLVTTVLFFGYPRYRFPIEGVCIVLSASMLTWRRPFAKRAGRTQEGGRDREKGGRLKAEEEGRCSSGPSW